MLRAHINGKETRQGKRLLKRAPPDAARQKPDDYMWPRVQRSTCDMDPWLDALGRLEKVVTLYAPCLEVNQCFGFRYDVYGGMLLSDQTRHAGMPALSWRRQASVLDQGISFAGWNACIYDAIIGPKLASQLPGLGRLDEDDSRDPAPAAHVREGHFRCIPFMYFGEMAKAPDHLASCKFLGVVLCRVARSEFMWRVFVQAFGRRPNSSSQRSVRLRDRTLQPRKVRHGLSQAWKLHKLIERNGAVDWKIGQRQITQDQDTLRTAGIDQS